MIATAIELSILMWAMLWYGWYRLAKIADQPLSEDH